MQKIDAKVIDKIGITVSVKQEIVGCLQGFVIFVVLDLNNLIKTSN